MSSYYNDYSNEPWYNTMATASTGTWAFRHPVFTRSLRQIREDFREHLEKHRPIEPKFLEKHPPQTAKVIPRKWGPKSREQRTRPIR